MPKFQSTVNPKEIIEVSEERAPIFRSRTQTGWQEYFEEVVKSDIPTNHEQGTTKTAGKRSYNRKSKHLQ